MVETGTGSSSGVGCMTYEDKEKGSDGVEIREENKIRERQRLVDLV